METRRHSPTISAWMESCFLVSHSYSWVRPLSAVVVVCSRGIVWAHSVLPLTIHLLIDKIKAELPGLTLNVWYLDDGTLMGHPDDLAAAPHIVETMALPLAFTSIGASLSSLSLRRLTRPSHLFHPTSPPLAVASLFWAAPLAPSTCAKRFFWSKLLKVMASLGALWDMGDSQLENSILRSCLALPKVSFVLRTCPPSHICHTTVDFDSTIRESLESIVGGPLSDWSWLKASLPSSRGGFNLCNASLHAPAAFLASSSVSQPLVEQILGHPPGPPPHIRSALPVLASAAVHPDWQFLDDINVPLRQNSLSLSIDDASFQHLLSSAPSIRSRALAHSSILPHAGGWFNMVPSASLGLHLQDREF